jgi:hypothetical protein
MLPGNQVQIVIDAGGIKLDHSRTVAFEFLNEGAMFLDMCQRLCLVRDGMHLEVLHIPHQDASFAESGIGKLEAKSTVFDRDEAVIPNQNLGADTVIERAASGTEQVLCSSLDWLAVIDPIDGQVHRERGNAGIGGSDELLFSGGGLAFVLSLR